MRKPILFVAMMLLAVIGCYAQYPTQFTSIVPRDFGIQGGKDGKIYQIIVKNGKSKKELVNKTTDMLSAFNLIGEKVKLDVINDKMSEYTVPFCWPSGIGVHPYDAAPVIIYGDLRFEFYDGGVKLSLENLEESFFVVHYRPTNIGEKGTENYQKYQEYLAQSRELQKTTSAAGKLFAKIDKIQEIKEISGSLTTIGKNAKSQIIKKIDEANAERLNALIKYRDRVAEQMKLFKKMEAANEGVWYQNLESYINDAKGNETFMKYKNAADYNLKGYTKALEENKLYSVDKNRWERDMKYVFDGIFITLAEELDGTIEGIAEDGVQTWVREGELVVPTDPKKKAKYLKKNKSFTDFDSFDN